jgi:hypothetical protein
MSPARSPQTGEARAGSTGYFANGERCGRCGLPLGRPGHSRAPEFDVPGLLAFYCPVAKLVLALVETGEFDYRDLGVVEVARA